MAVRRLRWKIKITPLGFRYSPLAIQSVILLVLIGAGRTFPVQKLFLEDVLAKVDYQLDLSSPYFKRSVGNSYDPYDLEDDYVEDRRSPPDHHLDEDLTSSQVPSVKILVY